MSTITRKLRLVPSVSTAPGAVATRGPILADVEMALTYGAPTRAQRRRLQRALAPDATPRDLARAHATARVVAAEYPPAVRDLRGAVATVQYAWKDGRVEASPRARHAARVVRRAGLKAPAEVRAALLEEAEWIGLAVAGAQEDDAFAARVC